MIDLFVPLETIAPKMNVRFSAQVRVKDAELLRAFRWFSSPQVCLRHLPLLSCSLQGTSKVSVDR